MDYDLFQNILMFSHGICHEGLDIHNSKVSEISQLFKLELTKNNCSL